MKRTGSSTLLLVIGVFIVLYFWSKSQAATKKAQLANAKARNQANKNAAVGKSVGGLLASLLGNKNQPAQKASTGGGGGGGGAKTPSGGATASGQKACCEPCRNPCCCCCQPPADCATQPCCVNECSCACSCVGSCFCGCSAGGCCGGGCCFC